ncbi:MAG: hypothetical protein VB852_04820 [Deltaproteobacteria bacterium]
MSTKKTLAEPIVTDHGNSTPPIWCERSVTRLGGSLRRLINSVLSLGEIPVDLEVQIDSFSDEADRFDESLTARAISGQLSSEKVAQEQLASDEAQHIFKLIK